MSLRLLPRSGMEDERSCVQRRNGMVSDLPAIHAGRRHFDDGERRNEREHVRNTRSVAAEVYYIHV